MLSYILAGLIKKLEEFGLETYVASSLVDIDYTLPVCIIDMDESKILKNSRGQFESKIVGDEFIEESPSMEFIQNLLLKIYGDNLQQVLMKFSSIRSLFLHRNCTLNIEGIDLNTPEEKEKLFSANNVRDDIVDVEVDFLGSDFMSYSEGGKIIHTAIIKICLTYIEPGNIITQEHVDGIDPIIIELGG